MSELYDLEADGGWTSRQSRVAVPTERELEALRDRADAWAQAYMPRRSAQVARMQERDLVRGEAKPRLNPVNGHGLECACVKCPGWYEARARMAVAAQAYSEPVVPPRQSRPLVDVVLPVCVLMVVFSLCAVVVLPVVTPLVLMSAMGLGLIAICFAVIAVVGLSLAVVVRRTAREAVPAPRRTIQGRVVRR